MVTAVGVKVLPKSVQEIANVIGHEDALYLIGRLKRYVRRDARYQGAKHQTCVIMYVPKRVKPDHPLVQILGHDQANRLCRTFGGEIMRPGNCGSLLKVHRRRMARLLRQQGWSEAVVSELLSTPEEIPATCANDAQNDSVAGQNGGCTVPDF